MASSRFKRGEEIQILRSQGVDDTYNAPYVALVDVGMSHAQQAAHRVPRTSRAPAAAASAAVAPSRKTESVSPIVVRHTRAASEQRAAYREREFTSRRTLIADAERSEPTPSTASRGNQPRSV